MDDDVQAVAVALPADVLRAILDNYTDTGAAIWLRHWLDFSDHRQRMQTVITTDPNGG